MHRCEVAPEDFGPLLLGQLTPSRARVVARQVAACPMCAAEAASLGAVVSALRAYPPDELFLREAAGPPVATGPEGLGAVLAGVQAERRRRTRRRVALAAVAVVAAAGVATPTALLLDRPDGPGTTQGALDVRLAGPPGSSGHAVLDPRRWGTAIHLEVSGLDPSARYGVWLAADGDQRSPAGSFRPTTAGTVELDLSSALPLSAGRVIGVSQLPAEPGGAPVDVLEAELTS